MAEANAQRLREKRLNDLGIQYPFWVFSIDQGAWPRKLADILPDSRPAKITGWSRMCWEYGASIVRLDDPLSENMIDTIENGLKVLGPVQHTIDRLRWDDSFDRNTFRVDYEGGTGQERGSQDFCDWVYDAGTEGYIAPRRIIRIVRKWDDVPVWDRTTGKNLLHDATAKAIMAYGIASKVHNDAELIRAAGVKAVDIGTEIRKAEFADAENGSQIRGVIYNEKFHEERGVYLTLGPESDWNKQLLHGTALENAPWEEVEEYVLDKRRGPLWLLK